MQPELIPVILTDSDKELGKKLKLIEGLAERVQIDVVDGVYAPEETFDLSLLSQQKSNLIFDIHLMVQNPFDWLEKCEQVFASRVIAQAEPLVNQADFIDEVTELGLEAGLALELESGIDSLEAEALERLNLVLLLAVKTGFSGQKFDNRVIDKIKQLKQLREMGSFSFKIGIDGGVNAANLTQIIKAGTDELAVGSAIFSAPDPKAAIVDLKQKIEKINA